MKLKKSIAILLVLFAALMVISCGRIDASEKNNAEKTAANEAAQTETVVAEIETATVENTEATETEVVPEVKSMPQQAAEPVAQTETQETAAEDEGCTVEANGYKVEVMGANIEKDYTGTDIIMVSVLFTNNNSSPNQYWNAIKDSASQNGMSLSSSTPIVDYSILQTATQQISNGQSVVVKLPYELKDASSKVDFTISIYNYEQQRAIASDSCSLTLK